MKTIYITEDTQLFETTEDCNVIVEVGVTANINHYHNGDTTHRPGSKGDQHMGVNSGTQYHWGKGNQYHSGKGSQYHYGEGKQYHGNMGNQYHWGEGDQIHSGKGGQYHYGVGDQYHSGNKLYKGTPIDQREDKP